MSFWLLAACIPLIAAIALFYPLLNRDSRLLGVALVMLLFIPVTSLFLYQGVGTPQAINPLPVAQAPQQGDQLEDLVVQLQQRLEESPGDLEGWMLLARSYKTMRQYEAALNALQQAQALSPENPLVMVELAEVLIFTAPDRQISPQVEPLLQQAIALDPTIQKGLWLLGIVAVQQGQDQQAIEYWQQLLQLLEPDSSVALTVQDQLQMAQSRLGATVTTGPVSTASVTTTAWSGVTATINATGLGELPQSAALFLIARDPQAPNPPLGAQRIAQPRFPIQIELTDANSMLAQRPISGAAQIEVFARLSMSGQPLASEGDVESQKITLKKDQTEVQLNLTARSP